MQENSYNLKEEAWTAFKEAMSRKAAITTIHNLAYNIYNDARLEYERMIQAIEESKRIWEEFNQLSEETDAKISELFKLSAVEHSAMCDAYTKSKEARNEKKSFLAEKYSQEGFDHREKRDEINEQISELKRTLYEARRNTKKKSQYVNPEELEDAKELMEHWRAKFNIEEEKMQKAKAECNELREIALKAQEKYEREKEARKVANNIVPQPLKAMSLYEGLREEYVALLEEDAEIMQTLKECNEVEKRFRKESDKFRRKIKKNWSLDKAGINWADRA